jgi:hypothetical protein
VTQIQTYRSGNYAMMEMSEMAMCGNIKAKVNILMVYTHYFEGEKNIFLGLKIQAYKWPTYLVIFCHEKQ